jgi:hypothetical protein
MIVGGLQSGDIALTHLHRHPPDWSFSKKTAFLRVSSPEDYRVVALFGIPATPVSSHPRSAQNALPAIASASASRIRSRPCTDAHSRHQQLCKSSGPMDYAHTKCPGTLQ